jgi:hypothetical protein
MSEYFKLTEACQKEVSRLQGLMHKQREVAKRELAVQAEKGDTYVCSRARTSLAFSKSKLQEAENEYKKLVMKCQENIITQEGIINRETTKKSATLIRTETEITTLEKKIQTLLANKDNYSDK